MATKFDFPDHLANEYFSKLDNIVQTAIKSGENLWERKLKPLVRQITGERRDSSQINLDNKAIKCLNKLKEKAEDESGYPEYDSNTEAMVNAVKYDNKLKRIFKEHFSDSFNLDSPSDDIDKAINDLLTTLKKVAEKNADKYARNHIKEVRNFATKQFDEEIKSLVGVNPVVRDPGLNGFLSASLNENIRLIKSIPSKYLDEVERVVLDGVLQGKSTDEIAEDVYKAGNKSTNNAKLIARDQTGNISMAVTKYRNEELGLKSFIWVTVGDDRVRSTHRTRSGKKYTWKDGANGQFPGEPIQCRCIARPSKTEVKEAFGKI